MFAVGTWSKSGVHVFSLESGVTLHLLLNGERITAIAFVDASTLAISSHDKCDVSLYTLDGRLLKQLAAEIITRSLTSCADGSLLVLDCYKERVRVFAPDGAELTTSLFTANILSPCAIALRGAYAYVLDKNNLACIRVFE